MDVNKILFKFASLYGLDANIGDLIKIIGDDDNYIDIYADGSSYFNNGRRLSGIGVFFGDNDDRNLSTLVDTQNNNGSEIIACIEALKIVRYKHYYINMYTDSRLVVDGMKGVCSTAKFAKLFEELLELSEAFILINWIHVKGHDGNYGNEKADELSRKSY